ncbi:mannitol dehydrogenase family protein [Actinoallomurus rhizosphaericola]|uniref:mannitol dehydrogenase family protein n=1 Tax=Actinoallomurus rhizosphaericola TaxID=2952536 RepID=UPI0020921428|nr:mannitol dehydrogenase family protein [Actinoallomurus rhizosphaericola]MCO5999938.1 mannitol dehydrogenase family protein [Actinoallomurus rhizosphaericola]
MRLSLTTRPRRVPSSVGIVHLGIGAFHRAHQAVYTEDAGDGWGICGITQRSATVVDQLAPQDGLYSVLERGPDGASARIIGAVREVLTGDATVDRIADPAVRIVSLTVTEKGYRHDPATGRLRIDDPEIRLDLAGREPRTVIGRLVRGLSRREAPVTVLCCDNLSSNGATLRGLVEEYAERAGVKITCDTAFPSTMVDRIVPATTAADLDEAERLLGVRDHGVVVTEPFTQWVIEDSFAAGRPAWDEAGAILTGDVAPYELMKLRLLNGSHSMLAYLGSRFAYVSEAVDVLGEVVRRYMDEDATPTLAVPDGFDLEEYKASLLTRFANPALRHRTAQIAMDGSQKLPQRLLGVVRDRLAAGAEPRWAALAVAAWMRHVQTADELDDPLAGHLRATVSRAGRPDEVVDALLAVTEVFGTDLRDSRAFRDLLVEHLTELTSRGSRY